MTDEPPASSVRRGLSGVVLAAGVTVAVAVLLSLPLLAIGMGPASVLVGLVAAVFVVRPISTAIGVAIDQRRGTG